tara:strand:- start:1716 stop:2012 length:297 start_codon:yes stop_codon:yes gene_type:complete
MKWKEVEDIRDYDSEARNLIRPLSNAECYNLYDIVLRKLKMSNSDSRDKELKAVKKAIESVSYIDKYRLKSIQTGFRGNMAQNARPKDGQTDVNRKKV